jgi:uncharacterized protein
MKEILTFTIYYGSFLSIPFLVGVIWLFWKKKHRFLTGFLILLSLSFIWSRFVEPQMLVVREAEGPANFVLISDQHLGQYKGEAFFSRVVDRINGLNTDFVLIPGDFVYGINPDEIDELFAPFADLDMPVYAVLGNHDMAPAGELLDSSLSEILSGYGVTWIDNITVINNEIQILGLGELWNQETDISTFDELDPELINIAVIHNPDGAYEFPEDSLDLVVAGHTHGGQIRIPLIYRWVVPTKYNWGTAQGWFTVLGNPLYITSGLGEIGLPMRLFNPPEIVHFSLSN